MRPSLDSADGSANDGTPRRGVSPQERRRLRSLLCGAGPARLPGRTPGGGGPRRASCASCTTSSLALAPVFCPRRAAYCCSSTFFSHGPALWWSAAARAMRTACSCPSAWHAVVASVNTEQHSRAARWPCSQGYAKMKGNTRSNMAGGGSGGTDDVT